ncbi:MAG: phtD [Gammaproteobacteria bacterium]|jgi:MFS family permease|nr:phtD [Gammaproteobacteria bacterium]
MKTSTFSRLQPWIVVFSAALFFFFEFINMNSFNSLNDELRQSFNVTALQVSNLSAMYFYANVLFLIPAGLMLDRVSTRKMLVVAMAICIASTYIFAFTHSFSVAQVCRFVTGMGSTLCLLSCAQLTSRWFPPRLSGLVIGLVVTMAMLGGVVAQQITLLNNLLGDWRYTLAMVATVGVLFWLIIIAFVRDYPENTEAAHHSEHQLLHNMGFWKSFGQALSNPQTWLAGLYTNLLSIPVIVLGALWGKDYLVQIHHLPADQAANISSMIFIGMIIGSPLNGWISDRLGRRKMPMLIGAVLTLLTVLIILYVQSLDDKSLLVLFFLLGLFSASQIITYPLIIESNPSHITASSESLGATIIMSCGAIFQPLFGYILQRNWSGEISNGVATYSDAAYQHAILILPIAFAVSIVIALAIKETYCKSIY